MDERVANLWDTEMSAKVAHEGIDPEAFNGLGVAMKLVELAAPLRVPEILPVGSFITSAAKRGFSTKVSSRTGRYA